MSNADAAAEQTRAQQRRQSLGERIAARTLAKQEEKFLAERAAAAQADRDEIIRQGREQDAPRRLATERMRSIIEPRAEGSRLPMQTEASQLSEREGELADAYYLDREQARRGYERSGILPSQEVSQEGIGRHEEHRFGSVAQAAKFGMRTAAPYAELDLDADGAVLGRIVYPGQENAAVAETEQEFPSMQGEAIDEAQREIDIALGRTAEPVPESEQQRSNKKRFPELFAGQAGYDGSGGRGGPAGPPGLTSRFPELYSGNGEGPGPIELGPQLGG